MALEKSGERHGGFCAQAGALRGADGPADAAADARTDAPAYAWAIARTDASASA